MATSPASHCEQLQEQNRLLRAQVKLLQANCQWVSSYNEILLDLCSDRVSVHSEKIPSSSDAGSLEEYYLRATNNISDHEMLDPTLSCESFNVKNLALHNHRWVEPSHPNISGVCDILPLDGASTSYQSGSICQMPELSLQSPSFWLETFSDSSTSHPVGQAAISSSDPSTSVNILPTVPQEFVDSGTNPYSLSSKSYTYQDFHSRQETDNAWSPILGNQTLYDAGTTPCSMPEDDRRPLESATSSDTFSANILNTVPGEATQEFPRLPALAHTDLPPSLWMPDVQQCMNTSTPQGLLDHYIYALRDFVHRLDSCGGLGPNLRARLMTKGVLWVVHEAWPQAEHFWKATASFQGFLQAELWRNFPDSSVYRSMHPAYKPTVLQLAVPHSPIIDWLPWPDLRDKLIASQEQIDVDLVCKTAIQNVVAHRRAIPQTRPQKRVRRDTEGNSRPAQKMSFRVWDLCILEETAGRKPKGNTALTYRPKSAPVRALEKAYALEYNDFQTQKLHPDFFTMFPKLFSQSVISDYTVQELPTVRNFSRWDVLGSPLPISTASLARLEAIST
ncbi:uncharacterized protein A1O9_12181 [Exophiala aquamarina CBS 119918]|uniref:BZIP domain-containing protein n=1 Tax=Exophiala aquamarina CBS 119918 TaxID=1182545 RepID=A0A072NXV2_9EURO|nr:uncharacterized protein A1O9_12181 [Exophiala aquamarina CBS 119918]KEF51843.1 hypothetical protein A1O9_12181 [Exophiala aquamarina CBS 119918]